MLYLRPELRRLGRQLGQGGLEAVAHLDLPALQRPDELALVVARDAQRMSSRNHAHDKAQHAGRVGSAVDEVADEHRLASTGRNRVDRPALLVEDQPIAELDQQ